MNRTSAALAALASLALVAALAASDLTAVSQPEEEGPASEAGAQERRLGTIDFPNSGAAEAQGPFIRGVLLLHSFEFEDAALEFQAAQGIDPDFAMAYWGEAMTYNHPLWRQQDRDAALAALGRYAPNPAARQAKAPNEREGGYFHAIDVLYGTGSKTERDLAYMEEMARMTEAYPDDHEARAFYALAILGSTDGERDFATYMRAAAAAQPVFDANPDHPGAAHYIIHSFDDPVHAPLGLEAARAYSEIAPGAAHAQHMTSHIFVAMGMWDDVVSANIRARDVQNARLAELGRPANSCGHYTSWLHYGWLMRGDASDAERGMTECHEKVVAGEATDGEVSYFVGMRARHVIDAHDWEAAERFSAPVQSAGYEFVTAYAALQQGDAAAADDAKEQFLTQLAGEPTPRQQIMRLELDALVALREGNAADAVAHARQAADIEEELPFEFGPPASLKPPHELLGEIALKIGDADLALASFRRSLEFTPERSPSLEGLEQAARALGRTSLADDTLVRLRQIREGSD